MSENKVGKWQLHTKGLLGKEVLKVSFCLIIPMQDPRLWYLAATVLYVICLLHSRLM